MKRWTREELLRDSGARPEELAELEARRTIVPNRRHHLFGKAEEYYTEGQVEVLRRIIKVRRVTEAQAGPDKLP